jgi:outer membrane protein assembly factor BamE (lipoprotein component of BamABCDE complex)
MRLKLIAASILTSVVVSGCGLLTIPGIQAGTNLKEVQSRVGAPHDQRTLPSGAKAWDYVYGPVGFHTWRVNFDTNDRVTGVEQLLTHDRFSRIEPNKLNRQDLLNMFGRPAQVSTYRNIDEEVWTYRYKDSYDYKLGDIHVDLKSGIAKYASLYHDPAYYNAYSE